MSQEEFQLIKRYFVSDMEDSDVLLGIGDDAAVVNSCGPLAVATDTLVSGIHFPVHMPPDAIGYRSLAVNLSDLSAMGAEPRWCTLALAIPDPQEPWLEAFAAGLLGLAGLHGVSLVGGDLTRGPLTVTVHLLGPISPDRMLTRGGGKVGDDVYVTGSLGDSAAGLELFSKGTHEIGPHHAALIARSLKPMPRVEEGCALSSLASAAIDISDGLLADLGHICEASDCGAVVDVGRVPLSPDLATLFPKEVAQAYALGGGDDYELCFTAAPAQAGAVESAMSAVGTAVQSIGRLVAGGGVICQRDGETFSPSSSGYVHFSS
ncbi:MAG: thiamine-phosphate kinase [Pseudomonadota bacterium]|nr:thiamine-phosphate kinase [Pseudomonadota bacterium]